MIPRKIVPAPAVAWTRADLDKHACPCGREHPEHATIGIGPTCCPPRTPMHASYNRETGQLWLTCSGCGKGAAVIQVAGAVPS